MRFGIGRGFERWFKVFFCVAVALLAVTAPSGATPPNSLPPGLQPTERDISNDPAHKYGESHIAVNPTNSNNLISVWVKDRYTLACQAVSAPICDLLPTHIIGIPFPLVSPRGYFDVPRFVQVGAFVSFNHGNSWQSVEIPLSPPDHPEFIQQGDPSVTAGPDGTFYVSWDALNWSDPNAALPNGGIATSQSTDGGLTWSDPVLTGTALDAPKITADAVTGRIYAASSGAIGRLATGNPSDPVGSPSDRFVVASSDGVNWTTPPRGLGGSDGTTYFAAAATAANPILSAANGVLSAAFPATTGAACSFFVGAAAPCIVFETSTDDGATWSRHAVPGSVITGNTGVAADPSTPGHFTVAGTTGTGTQIAVYQTEDSGATWTGPTLVADPAPFPKFFLWITYSRTGTFGMVWRAAQQATGAPFNTPFLVWTTISNDGGATFATPLQVSSAPSPPNPPGQFNSAGDDYSHIAFATNPFDEWVVKAIAHVEDPQIKVLLRGLLGPNRLYVTWADRRGPGGERSAYVGTVKLRAFFVNH